MPSNQPLDDEYLVPYKAIVEQAADAMIYSDRDGNVRLWNQAAESVFGFSKAEALGRNLDMIIPERFQASHWRGFNKAINDGHTRYAGRVMTTRSLHKSGDRLYIDMSFSLIKNEADVIVGVLAIVRDCTQHHLAEAAKK